jgi:hypothetical protein
MNWEKFVLQVIDGAKDLCVDSLTKYKGTITKDMQEFLEKSKSDFEIWSQQLITGELTKEDYETVVKGRMKVASFIITRQSELGKIEIEKLVSGLVNIIISTALRQIL